MILIKSPSVVLSLESTVHKAYPFSSSQRQSARDEPTTVCKRPYSKIIVTIQLFYKFSSSLDIRTVRVHNTEY